MNEDHSPDFLTIIHENRKLYKNVINDSPELAVVFKQKQFDEITAILSDIILCMEALTTSTIEKIERNNQ